MEWIRTYDSPCHGWDSGRGVTVDTTGNVYVTGREQRDDLSQWDNIWLGKYDANGNILWTETYDSPYHSYDSGNGVAVDAAGNVYVTGYESRGDLGQRSNIWLGKYDANGNILWTETYDNPYHGDDSGSDVAVDAAGNVYVTGYEDCGNKNIWLRKYDTNSNILWTKTYNSPANSRDEGTGVAVDSAGNVYVSGWERRDDLGQRENVWLRKYNTNGNILWTQTYDSPDHNPNFGKGVAVDAAGNVYVTGNEIHGLDEGGSNIWLAKYDANGNILWTETYDSPYHNNDYGSDVAVDAAGNVYVTGYELREDPYQNFNIWLRKYDTNGNVLWTETYESPVPAYSGNYGQGVAVDAAGNVYVTGYERERREDLSLDSNIILLKYSQTESVIPEPGTIILIGCALVGLAGVLRRKTR